MATPRDPLLERLQRAVAPDYRVEHELGSGGMGRVYLAHNLVLDTPVAIKVLRPELVSADGAAAFLREAQMLASIRHPNVVVIHAKPPNPRSGLDYYFMEFIGGPTLESRIASGPIPTNDVIAIGLNLLDGLATVHRLGLVHRDIKPSNVFVLPDRALLGDFGIACPPSNEDDEHNCVGTLDYMALEQIQGKAITPRTDIYALGVVLYEAVTGRPFHAQGENVNWSLVPFRLRRVLQRAAAKQPDDRWPDAATFRAALERSRTRILPAVVSIGAGALLIGAVVIWISVGRSGTISGPRRPACGAGAPGAPNVMFGPIEYVGPDKHGVVPDSLVCLVRRDLSGHVNFTKSAVGALAIAATLTVAGDTARLRLKGAVPAAEFDVPVDRWQTLRDSISYRIVLAIWAQRSALASSLPIHALPHTTDGLLAFVEAERLLDAEEWEAAHRAYVALEQAEPTCWICSWRITETERWLSLQPDSARAHRIQLHADSLPPLYRSIIHAAQLPLPARLDTLRAAAENARNEFVGWFALGDELFHRGPLAGHARAEAIPALERAARLRHDFAPAWEHLAWAATAEGDSADAAEALNWFAHHGTASDTFARALRGLLQLGFAWRFLPESVAINDTHTITSAPAIRGYADLGAGPRLLPSFDAPRGAIALGKLLQASTIEVQRSGLVAQTLGAVAIGRLDDARDFAHRLSAVAPDAEFGLFSAELEATLALLDPGTVSVTNALDDLHPWVVASDVDPLVHDRAVWMSALLDREIALRPAAPPQLKLVLSADSPAARARLEKVDPFFRTIVHFRRAAWRARRGDIEGARHELIWHEHTDVIALPTEAPQAAEVDWAFGTLARWHLARLLDGAGGTQRGEACEPYAAVLRHWTQAPAPYGARADTARMRVRALKCPGGVSP